MALSTVQNHSQIKISIISHSYWINNILITKCRKYFVSEPKNKKGWLSI